MCMQKFVLTNILALQLGPPKPKFLAPPLLPERQINYDATYFKRLHPNHNQISFKLLLYLKILPFPFTFVILESQKCNLSLRNYNSLEQGPLVANLSLQPYHQSYENSVIHESAGEIEQPALKRKEKENEIVIACRYACLQGCYTFVFLKSGIYSLYYHFFISSILLVSLFYLIVIVYDTLRSPS